MERLIKSEICKDLPEKIILISGPRQCGKTTLTKSLSTSFDYLNYDSEKDRQILQSLSWDRKKSLIIFDELHKMKQWKRWLKGIYDTEGIPPQLVVTGSAKLNTFKKVGDSLAGRYFQFRLHPLDLKELARSSTQADIDSLFEQLWQCSGFPEPFLKNSPTYYRRWRTTHLDIILRQDLLDLHTIHQLKSVENLIFLLRDRVGSTISYANLARDLQVDISTVKRWLAILEELYIVHRVTPYSKKVARSLLKEPKFYFYDHNYSHGDDGAKLENLVANALLKELEFLEDTQGKETSLHYLRTKDGKEIDFLVCIDQQPTHMIEVKMSDDSPSPSFQHFSKFLPQAKGLQLVRYLAREKTYPTGVEIRALIPWLAGLEF